MRPRHSAPKKEIVIDPPAVIPDDVPDTELSREQWEELDEMTEESS